MCKYKDIELVRLPNGKTAREVNDDVRREVERIYLESWQRGVSVPFFDNEGNTYLANPDGSEDRVQLNRQTRTYHIVNRTAQPGQGRYSYLVRR
ncbi:MAG: xenobiotic reductase B [Prevotella sp.]|nr:xenobiotic reductase B [Prevotella sp.]